MHVMSSRTRKAQQSNMIADCSCQYGVVLVCLSIGHQQLRVPASLESQLTKVSPQVGISEIVSGGNALSPSVFILYP
jgi:hypothetical protein